MTEMRHPLFAKIFADTPDKYPHALEQKFERVLLKVAELWATPQMPDYFEELMIDKRGDRQGFPDDVALDIFRLNSAYESLREDGAIEDPWGQELEVQKTHSEKSVRDFKRAIESNNVELINGFLDAGMPVDIRLDNDWTPLMVASFNSCEEAALLLIRYGANTGVADVDGYTPLHWAALNRFEKAVPKLIDRRADVNAATRFGITPLMQAAGRGHLEVSRYLIAKGANINHQDHEGWTALHKALSNACLKVSQLLISKGANAHVAHKSGLTPTAIAAKSKFVEIRKIFDKPQVEPGPET